MEQRLLYLTIKADSLEINLNIVEALIICDEIIK